ncbi:hypothetical protein ACOMHN_057307 [Nucella lapillus]
MNDMAPMEWRKRHTLKAALAKRCRGSLLPFSWSPLPLVLLLSTVIRVQANPMVLPLPPPATVPPSHHGHRHSEHMAGQSSSLQEQSFHPCHDYDQEAEPQILYAEELFARMLSGDGAILDISVARQNWERITISCSQDAQISPHTLSFNVSWLRDSNNITMAKVLVITNPTSSKNGCQPQLKESRYGRRLPCENKPFQIRHLAAVDVTSLLTERLEQTHLQVYVKRMRHVVAAVLVVFNDLSPQELFEDEELKRCRVSAATLPVAAMDLCFRKRKRRAIRKTAGSQSKNGEHQRTREDNGLSVTESIKRRMLQPAGNGHYAKHAGKLSKNPSSSQLTPFQTPAHLQHYLNERRKRSTTANRNERLESVTRAPGACERQNFTVLPFYDLNLEGLISPTELEIGKCTGDCPAVVLPSNRVPTYSHLASLLHVHQPNQSWPLPRPSCKPTMYQSFSVIRFVGNRMVYERWHNARVVECTCF